METIIGKILLTSRVVKEEFALPYFLPKVPLFSGQD
jgi:hypothetical protein